MRLKALLVAIAVMLGGCYMPFMKKDAETIVREEKSAVLHLIINDEYSCTAFHLGKGLFATAAHCLGGYPEKPYPELNLTDQNERTYTPKIVAYDLRRDLALLSVSWYSGPKLELWDEKTDGKLPLGMEIMGLGFPGYFDTEFTFDFGQVRGEIVGPDKVKYVLSRDLSTAGYSGGPIVSMHNGKVIAITHAAFDRTHFYDGRQHVEAWITLAISVTELENWLHELKLDK